MIRTEFLNQFRNRFRITCRVRAVLRLSVMPLAPG
jgi:hypothetical protein